MKGTTIDRYPSGFSRKATDALFHYRAYLEHNHKLRIVIKDMDTFFLARIYRGSLEIANLYGASFLDLEGNLIGFDTGFRAYEKIIKEDIK